MCAGGLCADCRQEEESMMTLDQLKDGQPATVRRINGKGAVRRRLMDMGLVKGIGVEMVKAAPLGDPVEYLVRGYHLSLRKSEAQMVEIELC
jgi:ferrous iron transport protein A